MAFKLYREYQLETLAERFVREVYTPGRKCNGNLLAGQTVIVQTRGVGEYLRQYVANARKIASGLDLVFFNSFINSLFCRFYGDEFRQAALRSDKEYIQRKLMALLSDRKFVSQRVPELEKYTVSENGTLKCWQLAGKTADLFEQYQLYRVDELAKGTLWGLSSWQKTLYCELFNQNNPGRDHFFHRFRQENFCSADQKKLPTEVVVFGVGVLPPVYLEILVKLSELCEVKFFYLSSCQDFWVDELSREELRNRAWDAVDCGNPILQALGRQGRNFFAAMMSCDAIANELEPPLEEPDSNDVGSMLEVMQRDILYMFDRRKLKESENNPLVGTPRPDLKNDRSISVHSCHSLRREVEVLHDALIRLIQEGVAPHEIIVMAPDIVKCAPVIQAVFSGGPLAEVYSIADLSDKDYQQTFDAFHRLLQVADSRFEYSSVMSLLDMPCISNLLGMGSNDLARIGKLLLEGGVRWGFDGDTREKFCGSNFEEFSFKMVFERLLTGFVCRFPEDEMVLINNISAIDAVEGSEIDLLVRVIKFMEKLSALADGIRKPLTLDRWHELFSNMAEDFFCRSNEQRNALVPLRKALEKFQTVAGELNPEAVFPLNTALAMLDDMWDVTPENGHFLRGRITFCRMVPMRSIPHKAVAILELNEKDFPRREHELGFDLIALHRQGGDRDIASQDRFLLLEALLSARKELLLFYQGRNSRNNELQEPCAPLSEIIGYLKNAFEFEVHQHKLSGIHVDYFDKASKLAAFGSFNMDNFQALNLLAKGGDELPEAKRLTGRISGLNCYPEITLDELVDFFENHCRWVLRNQFGLSLYTQDAVSDCEPWELDRKERWRVDSLISSLGDAPSDELHRQLTARNLLPVGQAGWSVTEERSKVMQSMPEDWKEFLTTSERRPVACVINITLPESGEKVACRITGAVNMSCDGKNVLVYQASSYKAKSALRALLGVLISAVATNEAVAGEILNITGNDFEMRYIAPVTPTQAYDKLAELLQTASQDVEEPYLFFPESTPYYKDLEVARQKFYTSRYNAASKNKEEYGDITKSEIAMFYTADYKDSEEFETRLAESGQMLYELIQERSADDEK